MTPHSNGTLLRIPDVSFDHMLRMSDGTGIFEHARLRAPRTEGGYCVDDVARALLVAVREPAPSDIVTRLSRTYLAFIIDAQSNDGCFHNRRGFDRSWKDEATTEDCWGRALWGLGSAVAHPDALSARRALAHFEAGAVQRSPHTRSMAFAAMGAAEVLRTHPGHGAARALLADAARAVGSARGDPGWMWPEDRLRYANAVLPETLLAAGSLLGDPRLLADGLSMLDWLLHTETRDHHLSVTPVAGRQRGDAQPGFDQQPIETAALADACARAYEITGDMLWKDAVIQCAGWFLGDNDTGVPLYDPVSGGGCDGLTRSGRNENQGAESTIAMISTFQQAHRL